MSIKIIKLEFNEQKSTFWARLLQSAASYRNGHLSRKTRVTVEKPNSTGLGSMKFNGSMFVSQVQGPGFNPSAPTYPPTPKRKSKEKPKQIVQCLEQTELPRWRRTERSF